MGDCGLNEDWAAEQLRLTLIRAAEQRIPYSTAFDLTRRCNQRCVHCFLGRKLAESESEAAELTAGVIVDLFDQLAAAGCMNLALSGGEPLLRRDFCEIYFAARSRGMLVQVFTNATLVSDEHLDVFAEYPPDKVDVSIYAATEETYERVTGVKGAHARALRGIERLLERGVRVGLKTMILRENAHEILELEALATRLGTSFRLDPIITPRLDGDPTPLEQRVDPVAAAALDMGVGRRREDLRAFLERSGPAVPSRRFYQCQAGRTGCHIDPQGVMRPCFLSDDLAYSTVDLGVEAAWSALTAAVDEISLPEGMKCTTCDLRLLCGYCPALFRLETAAEGGYSEYVCATGAARHAELQNTRERGQ